MLEMNWSDLLSSIGISPDVLAAGGFGGVLRALSRKKLRFREVILSPICGALAAAYLTLPVVHYLRAVGWPLPAQDDQTILASAFLLGTCAMWISDLVFGAIAKRLGLSGHQSS